MTFILPLISPIDLCPSIKSSLWVDIVANQMNGPSMPGQSRKGGEP